MQYKGKEYDGQEVAFRALEQGIGALSHDEIELLETFQVARVRGDALIWNRQVLGYLLVDNIPAQDLREDIAAHPDTIGSWVSESFGR